MPPERGNRTSHIGGLEIVSTDDRFDGGERELGIVGVLAAWVALDLGEVSQQRLTLRQLVVPVTLEWGTKGIPDGAAKQAAEEAVFHVRARHVHRRLSSRPTFFQ